MRSILERLRLTNHEIEIEDDNGDDAIGRFTGKLIAKDESNAVYLTEDERLILYSPLQYWVYKDLGELVEVLDNKQELCAEVARALGCKPIIYI